MFPRNDEAGGSVVSRLRPFATAGTLTFLLGACGGSVPAKAEATKTPEAVAQKAAKNALDIKAEYLPNGSRILHYTGEEAFRYADILQVCVGVDMVSQTQSANYGGGNIVDIQAAYKPCQDGKLTPEDFVLPGTNTSSIPG